MELTSLRARASKFIPKWKYIIPIFILLLIPLLIPDPYILHTLIFVFFFAYLAESWNIIAGYCGQLNLAAAAFCGFGGYISTALLIYYNITPWIGMLVGGIATACLGVLVFYTFFRFGVRAFWFSLGSAAFSETLRVIFLYLPFFGASRGIVLPMIKEDYSLYLFQARVKWLYYYIMLGLMWVIIYVVSRIEKSKAGYYFVAIREDEDAAASSGVNITKYKLLAAAFYAFFSAIGGTFYTQYMLYIQPNFIMDLTLSVKVLLIGIIGGLGTTFGPVIAAFILVPLSFSIYAMLGGSYVGVDLIVYGFVVILIVIFQPEGVIRWFRKAYASLLALF